MVGLMPMWLRHRREDDGAGSSEYALLVAGIAVVIVSMVFLFGGKVQTLFNNTCSTISSAGKSTASTC